MVRKEAKEIIRTLKENRFYAVCPRNKIIVIAPFRGVSKR
jgi:hypothetical protein